MQVLYEDTHLFAVHKPGGLAVQPDKTGDPDLLALMEERFTGDRSLGLPHRLDRPVSGVVLITRTPQALAAMSGLFAERAVRKIYWAIVAGEPARSGMWAFRLAHDAHKHKAMVTQDSSVAMSSTVFTRLATGDRYSLIELVPDGGRFHQLRALCAAAGFPIKGDVKYGARRGEKDRTIALHARSVSFEHPFTGNLVHIEAETPPNALWKALLEGDPRR